MNLLCGIMGVIFTFNGRLDVAFYLMLAGAACDFCDGLVARALKAYSELGKQLDSLADMVTFGVLPALMLHVLMLITCGEIFLSYIPLHIAVFSALRLAKFNIDERQSENFIGLATPACAIICGSFACYLKNETSSMMVQWAETPWFIPVASLILCGLLVSEIPMFSMKFKKGADRHSSSQPETYIPWYLFDSYHHRSNPWTELGDDSSCNLRDIRTYERRYLHLRM